MIQRLIAAGLTALALVAMLAACGSDPTPTPRPTATPRTPGHAHTCTAGYRHANA